MKHSLLFPLALLSLTLTSCSLIRGVDSDVTLPTEAPAIITPQEEAPIVATPEEDKKPNTDVKKTETDKKTPTTNTATPAGTPKQEEVSTEDLTKELDAFVDDITKGL